MKIAKVAGMTFFKQTILALILVTYDIVQNISMAQSLSI